MAIKSKIFYFLKRFDKIQNKLIIIELGMSVRLHHDYYNKAMDPLLTNLNFNYTLKTNDLDLGYIHYTKHPDQPYKVLKFIHYSAHTNNYNRYPIEIHLKDVFKHSTKNLWLRSCNF